MRRVVWFALLVGASAGCGKKAKPPQADANGGGGGGAPAIAKQEGNLTVRGGEGAIQAPRMAAGRLANEAELKDFHLAVFQHMQLDAGEKPPGMEEAMTIVKQNPKLAAHVKDGIVVITGSQRKDGVFAYTQHPQRADQHFVVTRQGVELLTPADLKQRLEAQGSKVQLAK